MEYAPIIIPTLCRYEHFKNCVESLSQCIDADKTELFIGLDYPAKEDHWEGYSKINTYIDTISGFKKVNVYRREINYGPIENIRHLREVVSKRFERCILTEDDNVFSKNFLVYINEGLERYKNDPKIYCICGYSRPYELCQDVLYSYPFNIYPMKSYSAWGTGYWFDKRKEVADFLTSESAYKLLHSWKMVRQLFKHHLHITVHRLLFRQQTAYSDLMLHVYLLLNNRYCIFPTISKVRNCGFDGSGLNCTVSSVYGKQTIDTLSYFEYDNIEIADYPEIVALHKKLYEGTWWKRQICVLEYICYRLFKLNSQNRFLRKIHLFLLSFSRRKM